MTSRAGGVAGTVLCLLALAACSSGTGTGADGGGSTSCTQHGTAAGYSIDVVLSPCPVHAGGVTDAAVTVKDGSGQAVTGATLSVHTVMEAMDMPGNTIDATADSSGYQAKLLLGMSGPWRISLHLQPTAGSAADTQFTVQAK